MSYKLDKKIINNFVFQSLFQLVAILVPVITTPHLCRTIGAAGIGDYSYTYTVGTYFAMFCLLGMNTYGNRECAYVRDDKKKLSRVFWEVYGVQLLTSTLAVLAFLIFVVFFAKRCQDFLWLQTIYIIGCALDVTWLFYGLEDFGKIVFRNILVKIAVMTAILTLVRTPDDTWLYVLIMSLSILASQLVLWPFVRQEIVIVKPEWPAVKSRIWPALRVSGPQLCYYVYIGINKLLVAHMIGMDAVAYLSNAEGMSRLPAGVVTALAAVLLPRVSNLYAKGEYQREHPLVRGGIQITMAIALPCAFGLSAIAESMVPWYYGEEFLVCGTMIHVMAFLILFVAWGEVLQSQYLVPTHQDKVLLEASVMGIAVSMLSNLVLIYFYGVEGAGYAILITEGTMVAYKTWCSRRGISFWKMLKEVVPFIVAAIIMYIVVSYLGRHMAGATPMITIKQILVGGCVYAACAGMGLLIKNRKRAVGGRKAG
ncbi:MAG: oligosaccharide flippase family protein [Lachnospiraceae bacterium]|jgi:O-antigen/teichoic acid export membrane protein|nr:oligosaccharide flippase family protein [Lachnospiraceae bacterium]